MLLLNAWSSWLGEPPALEAVLRRTAAMLRAQADPAAEPAGEAVLRRLTPLLVLKVALAS